MVKEADSEGGPQSEMVCPECNEELIPEGRCRYCPECGWSMCDL